MDTKREIIADKKPGIQPGGDSSGYTNWDFSTGYFFPCVDSTAGEVADGEAAAYKQTGQFSLMMATLSESS